LLRRSNLENLFDHNENIINNQNSIGAKAPTLSKKKFIKPSIPDIQNYCLQRSNNIDPEQFYNFYEAKGWLIGKSPMKSWQAAIRTWENREREKSNRDDEQNFGVKL
jgi:hypothetical protein